MSEYIITDGQLETLGGIDGGVDFAIALGRVCRELPEVVNCRDCKWYGFDDERYSGHGCIRGGFGSPTGEMPDGFCAWGVRAC